MKIKLIIIATFFSIISFNSLLSQNLLFKPLTANPLEGRIGATNEISDSKLRLDIGASFDLIKIYKDSSLKINGGTDFFTYTRLRSEEHFKFPVETSDYFFGVNFSGKFKISDQNFGARLRAAHISSHLVDGYSSQSVFFQAPFVYSREFLDFVVTWDNSPIPEVSDLLRLYAGFTYAFSITPDNAEPFFYQVGIDFEVPLTNNLHFYAGIDQKAAPKFCNFHQLNVETGLKIITSDDGKGVSVFCSDFYGTSLHGMFYNQLDKYFAIGFSVNYF